MATTQQSILSVHLLSFVLITSLLISASSEAAAAAGLQLSTHGLVYGSRVLLEVGGDEGDEPVVKKKKSSSVGSVSSRNQTKLIKGLSSDSSKNQTKLIKIGSGSSKNQTKPTKGSTTISGLVKDQTKLTELASGVGSKNKTKLTKPTSDSAKDSAFTNAQIKKLNSTASKSSKPSNSTKTSSNSTKKTSDLTKASSPKNKTTAQFDTKSKTPDKNQSPEKKAKTQKAPKQSEKSWIYQGDDDDDGDLISGFRDLPYKFQETFLPDLEKISSSSKVYLSKANKEITKGFKPIVGNKYAPTIASVVSFAFILIPLVLVSLIFNRIKAYFSLQKLLIFIQIYLSIYFSILCLSSVVTGLEPLRFLYSTSRSTYLCLQVLQTLAYVLYLLMLLMYLVLIFSTETGLFTKMLGLGETLVGFAVGLHYYVTVFHKAVLRQPPKTSWKVHAIYATCFLVICLLARADRRKKAYLVEGGEEGKKS